MRIGVIGQSGEIAEPVARLAEEVGREIGNRGFVLLTGGTTGVMEWASRGCKSAGGLVVGILPGDETAVANQYVDIPITTGFGFDYRSLVLVHSSDVLIMVSGGNGTLGELSAAYLNQRPVVVVEPTGGWAARVREVAYDGKFLDHRKTMELGFAQTSEEALDMAVRLIQKR
ncbi:TIGR00725 family protein [Alicyclobacillus tolerans]|uniref:TIGR00725 family protein n=1 Tax=Alicyclobacillus tolerans TaxID=90970 RepID=UPI001F3DB788|nr:TIGR00725 family protein [Alicyclobacillus tolerans]MCF8563378.1 TIGR00725 family protein [Alicyclobacillus tolerans]